MSIRKTTFTDSFRKKITYIIDNTFINRKIAKSHKYSSTYYILVVIIYLIYTATMLLFYISTCLSPSALDFASPIAYFATMTNTCYLRRVLFTMTRHIALHLVCLFVPHRSRGSACRDTEVEVHFVP